MHVHFGLHLDGMDPAPPRTAIGEATVGPKGLLRMLESDLGLAPVLDHPAEQLMAFRGCLAAADGPQRFYHRSFQVDPINVAGTLMWWRERWYEAGWRGTFADAASQRLADMGEVERLAAGQVPLCTGQRLARILDSMGNRRTQIETLTLHEEVAGLPEMWRRLVERLGYELAPGVAPRVNAAPGTDLHLVQARLRLLWQRKPGSESAAEPGTALAQDGTFIVVRAASRDISAQAVAEQLGARGAAGETVLVAENNGIILDNAMERCALPRCGFQHYSRFRAVSQVLKLSLALLWEPLNPHLLLQFLIHPVGPVRARARRRLAEAVAAQPGIGGGEWQHAVERLEQRLSEEGAADKDVHALRADLDYWFHSPRHDPAQGAPLGALAERAQRCANWLAGRAAASDDDTERTMFGGAQAQAAAFMAALAQLQDQGRDRLPRVEAERLVDEVSREQPDPALFAEAGHARATTHPANVTQTWPNVIWWDLDPHNEVLTYPWSNSELGELRGAGVALPTAEERLAHRSRTWLRPILNCTGQLVLVVHHSDQGHHPLWTQIATVFENRAEVDLESQLLEGAAESLPFLGVSTESLALRPLPAPRRWWELPREAAIPPRAVESYSSLSKLFYHPHQWVLNYAARLRKGRAEDVADQALLYGTLAHRLFEEFFNAHHDWHSLGDARIMSWLEQVLPKLVREEGAVLLEPGRGVDHEQVVTTLERSLLRLVEHLKSAGVVHVVPELSERAPFLSEGMKISGAIDLLLTTREGRKIVLDAKWGSENFRARQLEENLHLQLASYAYLLRHAGSTYAGADRAGAGWPYQVYFIIKTGNILAPDAAVFPEALVHAPPEGPDVAALWSRAETTYIWRRGQLDHGHVEVAALTTEPTQRSNPPENALPGPSEADPFDDFHRLTGWDEFA